MKLLIAAIVVFFAMPALAKGGVVYTGTDLLPMCRAQLRVIDGGKGVRGQEALDAVTCMGYMFGLIDAFSTADVERDAVKESEARYRFCLPSGVEVQQVIRVWVKYADDHPEYLNLSAGMLFRFAANRAWPCSK